MRKLQIRLTPRASRNYIGETGILENGEEYLKIYVTAIAEGNKANDAMITLLSKHFNLARSRIAICKGAKSRNKVVILDD